jgi:hypothetical protein
MKYLPLVALMLVAGCDKPSGTNNVTVVDRTDYAQEMLDLPENLRMVALLRAIRDAGLPCQGVTSATLINPDAAKPEWRAQCENGNYHLVTIDPNGTALVVSRTDS